MQGYLSAAKTDSELLELYKAEREILHCTLLVFFFPFPDLNT